MLNQWLKKNKTIQNQIFLEMFVNDGWIMMGKKKSLCKRKNDRCTRYETKYIFSVKVNTFVLKKSNILF